MRRPSLWLPVFALLVLLAAAASAQDTRPPHERPLVWADSSLSGHVLVARDSVHLAVSLPWDLVPPREFVEQERHLKRCVGGHWTLAALRTVRYYERYRRLPDAPSHVTGEVTTWDERPLLCVESYRPRMPSPERDIWRHAEGDTLVATAFRAALTRCAPDGDPGFHCDAPRVVDRFVTRHGIEVVAVDVAFVDGYQGPSAPGARRIGPFYLARLPSAVLPMALFVSPRILGHVPGESSLRAPEVGFLRQMFETMVLSDE